MPQYKVLNVRVSPEAYEGISAFCQGFGLTVTAFFEAAGITAARNTGGSNTTTEEFVTIARQVDAERRRRSPRA